MSNFLITTISVVIAFYALAFVFFLFEVVFFEWGGDKDNEQALGRYTRYY
jgi:hypothetical protein